MTGRDAVPSQETTGCTESDEARSDGASSPDGAPSIATTVGPLAGVVVVDLTRVLSGPYATMLLGDLGATVIKIEDPKGGDTTRHSAPYKGGQSHYFAAINRNKQSFALDLTTHRGRELLLSLVRKADVLIENYRPGVMARLGLDEATLRAANPDLILCSISGFGQNGPLRDRIAYDVITQAMSGVLSTNGDPDGPPVRLSLPIGDLAGGMMATIGVIASLFGRGQGRGARTIDISLHDTLISMLGYMATLYDVTGITPRRTGSRHPSIVPYGTFRTSNGWLALAIFTTPFWKKFCSAIRRPELAEDPRYRSTRDRMANREGLEAMVEEIILQRSTAAWETLFEQADVPASAVLSVPEALEHEQTKARNMFPSMVHPIHGSIRVPGLPLRLGGVQAESPIPPPSLGENTVEVLRDVLKLDEREIADLLADGVASAGDLAIKGAP
jgi:crotonobetainyl-CoA:carnitine CoA-transferase CaiB-like acyl-CoA transferase